jgi:hypothetical protein
MTTFITKPWESRAGMSQTCLLSIFELKMGSPISTRFSKMRTHFFISIPSSCVETQYKATQQNRVSNKKHILQYQVFCEDIYSIFYMNKKIYAVSGFSILSIECGTHDRLVPAMDRHLPCARVLTSAIMILLQNHVRLTDR